MLERWKVNGPKRIGEHLSTTSSKIKISVSLRVRNQTNMAEDLYRGAKSSWKKIERKKKVYEMWKKGLVN